MELLIKHRVMDDTLLKFEKNEENAYECVLAENDRGGYAKDIYTRVINGSVEYQLIKPEYIDEYKTLNTSGVVLSVPSEWSYSKEYKNLKPRDALLIHNMVWGWDMQLFLDGEEVVNKESLREREARLVNFEV